MQLFTFEKLTIHYLYPILLSVSLVFLSILNNQYNHVESKGILVPSIFICSFLNIISMIICGLIQVGYMYFTKTKIKMYKILLNDKWKQLLIHLIGISLIAAGIIAIFISVPQTDFGKRIIEFNKCMQMLLCYFLCYFVLGIKQFKHHKISLIILFILSFFIFPMKGKIHLGINSDNRVNLPEFLIYILYYLLYCSMEVYEKYLMQYLFVPPYLVLFFKGIVLLVIFSIAWVILELIHYNILLNYSEMFRNIPILICFLFSYLLYHILRIQTINKYSPSYRYVSDILSQLVIFIIDCISIKPKNDVLLYILVSILYVMIILGMLVYQEVIVMHFWGMDENTTNIIKRRAEMDEKDFENMIDDELLKNQLNADKEEEERNKEVDISLNNIN